MTLENFVCESVSEILNSEYDEIKKKIEIHKDIYRNDTAICFSLLALNEYENKVFPIFYQFMNDADFLVEQSADSLTKLIHEMIMGYINFKEKNLTLYSIAYNKARKLAVKEQCTDFFEKLNSILKCPPITHNTNHGAYCNDPLISLVNI